jgi:mannose-1-phosphate guanylyltransferase/phosphomannomutase
MMRSKARLTITLDKDLLKQVDQMIDQVKIRNRSHAIETILRESLNPEVSTAVILAGGKTFFKEHPALLHIDDRKLISITLEHLSSYGIRRIFLLTGHNSKAFREILGEGERFGARIFYVEEKQPLGTAGAVKSIEDQLKDESFLVIHADVLTNIDLAAFIDFYRQERTLATIAVKPRDAEKKYGKVLLQGNKITEFSETGRSEGISIINTGVYLLHPDVLKLIDHGTSAQFEIDVFPKLAALNELSAFLFQGIWFDISDSESYEGARTRWSAR